MIEQQITAKKFEFLTVQMRDVTGWPEAKAQKAVRNILRRQRNPKHVVHALACGESYREALRAGTWEPEVFLLWMAQKSETG
jgi:hypothetical protein